VLVAAPNGYEVEKLRVLLREFVNRYLLDLQGKVVKWQDHVSSIFELNSFLGNELNGFGIQLRRIVFEKVFGLGANRYVV